MAGRGIDTNASPHIHSRSMVEFDLESAYDSVGLSGFLGKSQNFSFVEDLLRKVEFDPAMALLCNELVDYCHNNRWFLPQGAPTSPQLFNLICRPMDEKLIHLAQNTGGVATRYADNSFFSWPEPVIPPKIINAVRRIIEESGFTINPRKTKIQNNGNRLGVPLRFPGVNVMEGEFYIPRETQRRLRAKNYNAGKEYARTVILHEQKQEVDEKKPAAVSAGIKGYAVQVLGKMPSQLNREFQHGRAFITGEERT